MEDREHKPPFNYGLIWMLLGGMGLVFFGGPFVVLNSGWFSAKDVQNIVKIFAVVSVIWGVATFR